MRRPFMCCLLAFIFCSCTKLKHKDDLILPIDVERQAIVDVNDIFSNVEYIQLELNEDNPIGPVDQIEVVDNIIYLSDGKTLFQYSLDGKYLCSLNRHGRGPSEYINIKKFYVHNDYIYIIDRNAKLLKYSTDNKFIISKKIEFYPASCIVKDDKLLLTTAYQNEVNKFHVYNTQTLEEIQSFCPVQQSEIQWKHSMLQHNFYVYEDCLLYYEPMNNTILRIDIETMSVTPYHNLHFKEGNPPENFWKGTFDNVMDFYDTAAKKGYNVGAYSYCENRNYIFFSYFSGEQYTSCLYSKKNSRAVSFQKIALHEKIPAIHTAEMRYNFKDEQHQYIVISDSKIFNEQGEPYVKDLLSNNSSNGNPIILKVNLRKNIE